MNKIWYISVHGCGTPKYIIIAPDKETAWKMAQEEWAKNHRGHIGSSWNWNTGKDTAGNSIDDIKDTGIVADLKQSIRNILDLQDL